MSRYAALMLFQFRTEKNGSSNKRRLCEERIVLFEGTSAEECYEAAMSRGRDEEFSYEDGGVQIFFVGKEGTPLKSCATLFRAQDL